MTSCKGAGGVRVEIAEVIVVANSAARDYAGLKRQFLTRNNIMVTPCGRGAERRVGWCCPR